MVSTRERAPVLELAGISRAFGDIRANDAISLKVERGEILGLVGENGAGKSTLLSILAGLERADAGTVSVEGEPVRPGSSAASIRHGISLVHQHFSLVPTFTVAEQLRLAGWTRPDLPEVLGTDIPPNARIERLAPGQQQRVELAKALVSNPRILLLDEPTSILAPSEVDGLFETLHRLRAAGTAIVFVTHKIREVLAHADRIVVLRRGKVSGELHRREGVWAADSERQLVQAMFAAAPERSTSQIQAAPATSRNAPILTGSRLNTIGTGGSPGLRDVDVSVRSGTIHAVVGIDGQGQGTLADVLAGYERASGSIEIDGVPLAGLGAAAFAEAGIGFVSGERLRDGGVGAFTVGANLLLKRQGSPEFTRWGLIRRDRVAEEASQAIREWDIQPPEPAYPFAALSGGNMQKVLLAREFARQPRVLIAVNPVSGLDVQTARHVRDRLREFVQTERAALWFTNDVDDAMVVADTISIMFEGRLSPAIPVQAASMQTMSGMMVSGW